MAKKVAVILFNLGGPDGKEAVKPFLFNLFNDKAIIGLPNPFRFLLAKLISKKRAPEATEIYRHIGGSSPILELTKDQQKALEKGLKNDKNKFKVFISMRYWHPFSEETILEVEKYQPDEIILMPLYPQFSTTTTGSSVVDWQKQAKKIGLTVKVKTICCYPTQKDFVAAHITEIKKVLPKDKNIRILFSAHGLPEKIIKKGDPYQFQVEETVKAVVDGLKVGNLDYVTCYQSKVGPLEWIKPSTDDEIKRAAKDNIGVLIVPIAFVSEHSETLVELDIEYKEMAEKLGIKTYLRVPALGVNEDYISSLAVMCKRLASDEKSPIMSSSEGKRICPRNFKQCPCN